MEKQYEKMYDYLYEETTIAIARLKEVQRKCRNMLLENWCDDYMHDESSGKHERNNKADK